MEVNLRRTFEIDGSCPVNHLCLKDPEQHLKNDPECMRWIKDAKEALEVLKEFVIDIELSNIVSSPKKRTFINLTTREKNKYCIELSFYGFRVVGYGFNDFTWIESRYDVSFRTPYDLLESISPAYFESFKERLKEKSDSLSNHYEPVFLDFTMDAFGDC